MRFGGKFSEPGEVRASVKNFPGFRRRRRNDEATAEIKGLQQKREFGDDLN